MPFRTPQHIGYKQCVAFLAEKFITWEADYMKEGQEMSKQYREAHAQQRYLEGWEKAWKGIPSNQKEEV